MHSKLGFFITLIGSVFLFGTQAVVADVQQSQQLSIQQACEQGAGQNLAECERLAELGHKQAQFQMGNFYYDGVLLEQDYAQAAHWYTQASSQGHAQAQLQLGIMYANGVGVPVNKAQAFIILKMSAINGVDAAYDQADLVLLEMSGQELDIANRVLSRIFLRFVQGIQHSSQANLDYPLGMG